MLTVSVISPERILFEGQASAVVAPGWDGELGVLPGHAPLMTVLGKGVLRLDGAAQRFQVDGGFMQVVDNVVRVVTESATPL
ncbi:MAG: ATP synthase F1 subunit epsilon [Gemmatimonadaceae bacterium]|nr:ATP synthase F1 subunit epsilon [Gemmatimonadaceae bacterium]